MEGQDFSKLEVYIFCAVRSTYDDQFRTIRCSYISIVIYYVTHVKERYLITLCTENEKTLL